MGLSSGIPVYWITAERRHSLSARTRFESLDGLHSYQGAMYLSESDFVEIQRWCDENDCGRRTSYDTFQFRNQQEITAFLLRWS